MSQSEFILYGIMILVGVVFSAVYSGMEIGLYTLNRVRVTVQAGRGDRQALRLRQCLQRSNHTLSTLLIGNNIANYAGSFGLAVILDGMGYKPVQAIILNAGILIPLLFIFGETLPKDLFRTHTDRWSYATSGFLIASDRLFTYTGISPLVEGFGRLFGRLLGTHSESGISARQHISQLIKEGVGSGILSEGQTRLADRALALHTRTVSMEMVPWSRVAFLSADADTMIPGEYIKRHNFTRMPVIAQGGKVLGVLSILDTLLQPDRSPRQLTEPVTEFAPDVKVREALRIMRQKRHTMAIVTDPVTEKPIGLVTLKDLVEPLTGELAAW